MSKGRILVVDDTPELLRATRRYLTSLGFTVTVAENADEALENDLEEFDLVITDFNMPGRNGVVLAAVVKATRPGLPVILCTANGYVDHKPADAILHKPVPLEILADTIRRFIPAR